MPITHVNVDIKTSKVSMLTAFGWVNKLNFTLEVPFETEEDKVPALIKDTLDRAFEFVPEGNWSDNEEYVCTANAALIGTKTLITNAEPNKLKELSHYEFRIDDEVIYSIDITCITGEW